MLLSASLFVAWSWHWPLVGDASQVHYICFLMDHGMAPYRVSGDMNMPGALLVDWTVMHTLGAGSLPWRLFDLLTVAGATLSMALLTGRGHRLPGVGAGLLLLVLHGADGLNDLGERDLTMAALLLASYVCLFRAMREESRSRSFLFGLGCSVAATIKPTALPLAAFLLLLGGVTLRKRGARVAPFLAPAFAGLLLPFAGVLLILWKQRALGAFAHGLETAVPYYASLAHQPLPFLLLHSVSPVLPVVALWLPVTVFARRWRSFESLALAGGLLFGLCSYLAQAKGFPYYRYPLLAFLLPMVAEDCDRALRAWGNAPARFPLRARPALAACAAGALAYAAFLVAPVSAEKTHRFAWRDQQFIHSLTGDLLALHAADREVQCIDSLAGCGTTLLRLHLVQATGLLSDFFIFGPDHVDQAGARAIREARQGFVDAVERQGPPRILIVSTGLHLVPGVEGWTKLDRWPWLENYLAAHYQLVLTRVPTRPVRWWARASLPSAYRVYVRDGDAPAARAALAGLAGQSRLPPVLPEP